MRFVRRHERSREWAIYDFLSTWLCQQSASSSTSLRFLKRRTKISWARGPFRIPFGEQYARVCIQLTGALSSRFAHVLCNCTVFCYVVWGPLEVLFHGLCGPNVPEHTICLLAKSRVTSIFTPGGTRVDKSFSLNCRAFPLSNDRVMIFNK